jgi:LacI family transcriptional regulator
MGYRPSSSARATRTGQTGCYALVLSTDFVVSMLPAEMLTGIQENMLREDRHLILATLPDAKLTSEGFVPKILRELAADGLLINYNAKIPQQMIDLIATYRIPSVWINSKQSHNCVHPDDLGGARLATQRLLQHGHRRIAYVDYNNMPDNPASHYSAIDRWAGYAAMMIDAGLTPRRVGNNQIARAGQVQSDLRAVLTGPDRPTALICYSGRESRAAYHVAALSGLDVPRDLSILRFGVGPYDDLGFEFTVANIPEREVGRRAVEMLDDKIKSPAQPQPTVAVPYSIHEGMSVGPVPTISS